MIAMTLEQVHHRQLGHRIKTVYYLSDNTVGDYAASSHGEEEGSGSEIRRESAADEDRPGRIRCAASRGFPPSPPLPVVRSRERRYGWCSSTESKQLLAEMIGEVLGGTTTSSSLTEKRRSPASEVFFFLCVVLACSLILFFSIVMTVNLSPIHLLILFSRVSKLL